MLGKNRLLILSMLKILLLCFLLININLQASPININQADAETISNALAGIGPKKALAIIQYRNEHGEFKNLNDLKNVKGIGEKTISVIGKDIIFSEVAKLPQKLANPVKKNK